MADDPSSDEPTTDPRVATRADLLAEEKAVGSEDPEAQAEVILEEGDERTLDRGAAPGTYVEHRSSADATLPPD
jgi:hypothetical protein